MSDKFLRLTYEVPVENAGFAQAALIQLGGKALAIELVQEIARFNNNAPKAIKENPFKLIKQHSRRKDAVGAVRQKIRQFIDEQLAKADRLTLKEVVAAFPDMQYAAIQYHCKKEIDSGYLKRTKKQGVYAKGAAA